MPTVILLDVSLSMSRRLTGYDGRITDVRLQHLAVQGIHHFLDQISARCRLEFSALIAFSSLWEVVVPFTRDIAAVKAGCLSVDVYDKTCIENSLRGVETLVMEEWGSTIPINLILVTDGRIGTGSGSLKESLEKVRTEENKFPLPFSFPCSLSVVCLTNLKQDANEVSLSTVFYRRLIGMNNNCGEIYVPEGPLNLNSVEKCFDKIIQTHYDTYEGVLSSGNLKSDITLSPTPNFKNCWLNILHSYRQDAPDTSSLKMPSELKIIGFLDIADISNPPFISRHVVMPISKGSSSAKDGNRITSPSCSEEAGKVASFCVVLHGSLKIERMVAIIKLG